MRCRPGHKKVIAAHERLLERFDYEGFPKTVNKVVYAKPFAIRWDAGGVWLLASDWNQEYIDELCLFPQGRKMTKSTPVQPRFTNWRHIPCRN